MVHRKESGLTRRWLNRLGGGPNKATHDSQSQLGPRCEECALRFLYPATTLSHSIDWLPRHSRWLQLAALFFVVNPLGP